jgi:hypothetical protein
MADRVSLRPEGAPARHCRDCGAAVTPEATCCWLCGKDLRADATGGTGVLPVRGGALATRQGRAAEAAATPQGAASESPFAPGAGPAERRTLFQFSLASMLLIITLCAVVLGAFSVAPVLGIGLAVLATPALVWTCVTAMRRRARGQPMDPVAKVSLFVAALAIAALVAVAAGVAFYVTCWAGFLAGTSGRGGLSSLERGFSVGIPLGIVAALGVVCLAIWLMVRVGRRRAGIPRRGQP